MSALDQFGSLFGMGGGGGMNWTMINMVLWWILLIAIAGAGSYAFFRLIRYKYKVIIRVKSGGNSAILAMDLGRIGVDRHGNKKLYLLKSRKAIKLIDYENISSLTGGLFIKKIIELYKYGEDDYAPVKSHVNEDKDVTFVSSDLDKTYIRDTFRDLDSRYDSMRSVWEKYGAIIINVAWGGIFFLSILFLAGALKETSGHFVQAASMMSEAFKNGCGQHIQGVVP